MDPEWLGDNRPAWNPEFERMFSLRRGVACGRRRGEPIAFPDPFVMSFVEGPGTNGD